MKEFNLRYYVFLYCNVAAAAADGRNQTFKISQIRTSQSNDATQSIGLGVVCIDAAGESTSVQRLFEYAALARLD